MGLKVKMEDIMLKESILEIKMDSDLKEQAERLYEEMGTTFAEAIRIFARQSVMEKGMPFTMHLAALGEKRTLGIANGKYSIPDDIDECNGEIAKMFGVGES